MSRKMINSIFIVIIFVLISSISVGYSALSTSLQITGDLTVESIKEPVIKQTSNSDRTASALRCDGRDICPSDRSTRK